MKLKYKKLIGKAIVIGCLVFLIVLTSLLKTNEDVSEYFFSRGISRAYVYVAGHIAALFPFSLFDIFVTLGILTLILSIIFFSIYVSKKRGWKAIALVERVLIAALCVALVYTMVASGNYYRKEPPLPEYEGEQLSVEETAELCKVLLGDYAEISATLKRNEDGSSVCPYTFEETVELIRKEYEKLSDPYFSAYVPSAKEGWYSDFLTSEGITGITFLPTGDAVVNGRTPQCYKILTTAHELAHAVGCMRESDANLMAYYVLLTSDVPYFRYCAYMYSIGNLTSILARLDREKYNEIIREYYPKEAIKEVNLEYDFWEQHHSFLEDVGDFLNDLYLKLSGSADGTGSYNDYSQYSVHDDGEKKEIRIKYSQTARVLLKIAMDRQ